MYNYKTIFGFGFWDIQNYYTLSSLSLLWLTESVQWIFVISTCDIITADYTIIMSRSRVIISCHAWPWNMISKCNHVKFARVVLLDVSEELLSRLATVKAALFWCYILLISLSLLFRIIMTDFVWCKLMLYCDWKQPYLMFNSTVTNHYPSFSRLSKIFLKGLGHAILDNFSTDQIVIEHQNNGTKL